MPTYEYRCPDGHTFECFQKMTEKPRAKCPTCGRMAKRQISGGAGLVFKGSGFYITDYGKDGKGPRRKKDTAQEGKAETSDKPKDSSSASSSTSSPKKAAE